MLLCSCRPFRVARSGNKMQPTWHLSEASLVMKEMNSETHSCTHSRASLAILPCEEGMDFFMMRATLAMGRKRSWKNIIFKMKRLKREYSKKKSRN